MFWFWVLVIGFALFAHGMYQQGEHDAAERNNPNPRGGVFDYDSFDSGDTGRR